MNYEELQMANVLLKEIKEIDFILRVSESPNKNIKVGVNEYSKCFGNEHKRKFMNIIKEIRDEMVEELKELGVTENE